jgi:CRP/FNR family cyclic AMP-dependent transcriptional regulator
MSEITKGMLEHPFFKDFQATHVELLSKCASSVHFTAGSYIFHDGETAERLYLIQTGKIAVVLQMAGRDPMGIMTVDAGGVVGWSWLFPPYRWHFSARVMEDTAAIALDAKCIMAKCKEDYQLGYELMRECAHVMGERLQATRAQLLNLMSS